MSVFDLAQISLFFIIILLLVKPLGLYIARVMQGEPVFLTPFLSKLEAFILKISGVEQSSEMNWKEYSLSVVVFSFASFMFLYIILRVQGILGFNPENQIGVAPHLAFNIASSFITNTNWQSYSGEATLSYFSQAVGLAVQNFVSPAVGLAIMFAVIRGFARKNATTIGNFWVDTIRAVIYVLLPISLLLALFFTSQGVVQTFSPLKEVELVESFKLGGNEVTKQSIPLGPAASQVAIKQVGTNGGGFYNANGAHPFENPTPLSNFVMIIAIMVIPAALCYSFGYAVGDVRQGWVLLAVKAIIFIPLVFLAAEQESKMNPVFAKYNLQTNMSDNSIQGNMEGKELRFGIGTSALWAAATTATSNGSVNSSLDSYSPLGGMVPMMFMKFGEVVFGGVGSGIYGILTFVIIAVFISGLMVGRTPEYLGKKLGPFEIKMASLVFLLPSISALAGTAIAVMTDAGRAGVLNPGPHGLSEVVYAFTSASNNNGSAFGGLTSNTVFYNTILGVCMLIGRFWVIIPVLAISGSLVKKNKIPDSVGTLRTDTGLFVGMLVGVIVLVGFLTYVPAIALGPVVEYLTLPSQ